MVPGGRADSYKPIRLQADFSALCRLRRRGRSALSAEAPGTDSLVGGEEFGEAGGGDIATADRDDNGAPFDRYVTMNDGCQR